jgi:DNA invertase Pin-like site-specific DNA recombinase
MADMVNKNRQRSLRGSASKASKLTESQVMEIRRLCAERVPFSEIASRFGITTYNVASIKQRKTWTHVP